MKADLFIVAAVGLGVVFAASADEKDAENAPQSEQRTAIVDHTVYRWVFGEKTDAGAARKQLDEILRQKVIVVDLICRLTDNQKQKLELPGRGDNRRLLDRIEEIGTRYEEVKNDSNELTAVIKEAHRLRKGLIEPGVPSDSQQFFKVLEKLLTAEQFAKYEPIRVLFRAGALVEMRQRGPADKVLHVRLFRTAVTEEDLVRLHELPQIEMLLLQNTPLTDAGLAHLKGLTNLRILMINDTQVTDSGLVHLKGMSKLTILSLDQTHVTDAGLEHLKDLTNLGSLSLDSTQVTDVGVAHLKGMTGLKSLMIVDAKVPPAALAKLRRALPGVRIPP